MPRVETRGTPLTPEQAGRELAAAAKAEGAPLTARGLLVLMSQSALETSGWRKMYNWNFGNVRPFDSRQSSMVLRGATEPDSSGRMVVQPEGSPGSIFRAFATPDAGARELVRQLRRPRFLPAWEALTRGDIRGFVAGLTEVPMSYFPASRAEPYAAEMARWAVQLAPLARAIAGGDTGATMPPRAPGRGPGGGGWLVAALAVGGLLLAARRARR